MKFRDIVYGVGIVAAVAVVADARATFYSRFHPSRTVVPGAYIAEFADSGSMPVLFDHLHKNGIQELTIRQTFDSHLISGVSFQVKGNHSVNTILDAPGLKALWPVVSIYVCGEGRV